MRKKLTKILAYAFIFGFSMQVLAQRNNIGIGTTTPDNSAVLDISANNKGLLIPRLSLEQRNNIQNPATGLMVYQTDLLSGFYFFDGKNWKPLTATTQNSVADANSWNITGNAGTTSANFIGTTDAQPLRFRLSNQASGVLEFNGATANNFLGRNSGISNSGLNNTGFGFRVLSGTLTGNENTAIGSLTMLANTSGSSNVGIGFSTMSSNTTGSNNMGLGSKSLASNTTGYDNTAIGNVAMFSNTTGFHNVSIGSASLRSNLIGSYNVAIGINAGRLSVGSSNIFIGYQAGYNETGNNKLYIANTGTNNPLIKGEFDNKNLKINLGSTRTNTVGFLAVGNFDASFAMPTNNSYRLIVQDGIITEKVKVALKTTADWADYVFEPTYQRMSLEDVENYVKANKHLPNVPSAEEMTKNGLDVTQTSAKLMEKIEELTLYMIELNKEIKELKAENKMLKNKMQK